MNSDLFFEGKQYISSSRAAKISGYANDYIGQLCRDGKLESRMVGRSWYVEIDSLICHKNNNANGTRSKRVKKLSQEDFGRESISKPINTGGSVINVSYPDFSGIERLGRIAPSSVIFVSPKPISSVSISSPQVQGKGGFARVAIGVCALFLALLGFRFGLFTNPSSGDIYGKVWDSVNQELEASVFSATKNATVSVYQALSSALRDWFFESRETILVLTGSGKVTINNKPQTSSDTVLNYPDRGMVVVPTNEQTDREGVVAKIKQSFSDEVVVTEMDKESGVITPVFKNSKGDDYLFVLVPIDG